MLRVHPKAETETARVSLTAFRDSSIEIEVFAHILETSDAAFLPVQEELLLQIMDIVRASGAKFAPPMPAPYPAKDRSTIP
jgi:MscS family membrane protein